MPRHPFNPARKRFPTKLRTQERKRGDVVISKAHQLFVKYNAKVALNIQYLHSGRTVSYHSDENWPSGADLEVGSIIAEPISENLTGIRGFWIPLQRAWAGPTSPMMESGSKLPS
jgi:hypothetical protein